MKESDEIPETCVINAFGLITAENLTRLELTRDEGIYLLSYIMRSILNSNKGDKTRKEIEDIQLRAFQDADNDVYKFDLN
jgi:hypothetical protein